MSKKTKVTEIEKFARKCDCCGKGMNEGFCINGGEEYFCDKECLHSKYTEEEWEEMYNGDEDDESESDSYWTTWDEEDLGEEEEWYDIEGNVHEN